MKETLSAATLFLCKHDVFTSGTAVYFLVKVPSELTMVELF